MSTATEQPLAAPATAADDRGVVTGRPRTWLRVEGLALLAAALVAFSFTGQAWWLLAVTLLLPDLAAVGYLAGARTGAFTYNFAHSTSLPIALLGVGLWQAQHVAIAMALVWLAHIGMDRAFFYGLKHDDDFRHTHLGWHGQHQH